MKTIESGSSGDAQWNNELITDLAFIKKKLRYRFSKKILYGSAGLGFALLIIIRTGYMLWIIDKTKIWNNPIMWLLLIALAILILLPIYSYTQIIMFKAIPTSFFLTENGDIIKQFLDSMRLVYYRHPDAPEVFQIMSKNLSASKKKEQREIVVFIADNKRILINSHYTVGSFMSPPSYNYRQMRKQLQKFVQEYKGYISKSIQPING